MKLLNLLYKPTNQSSAWPDTSSLHLMWTLPQPDYLEPSSFPQSVNPYSSFIFYQIQQISLIPSFLHRLRYHENRDESQTHRCILSRSLQGSKGEWVIITVNAKSWANGQILDLSKVKFIPLSKTRVVLLKLLACSLTQTNLFKASWSSSEPMSGIFDPTKTWLLKTEIYDSEIRM